MKPQAKRKAGRADLDPFTTEPVDPLELIGRLLVGSSYRVPVEGKGSGQGMQPADIAGAIGLMGDRLQRQAVVAVATRADRAAIAQVAGSAYRRVMREVLQQRPPPLDLRLGADRWRLRVVTFDAAHELVWPETRRPYSEMARAAKMRRSTYSDVHKLATSVLQQALNEGRQDFTRRLWGQG